MLCFYWGIGLLGAEVARGIKQFLDRDAAAALLMTSFCKRPPDAMVPQLLRAEVVARIDETERQHWQEVRQWQERRTSAAQK